MPKQNKEIKSTRPNKATTKLYATLPLTEIKTLLPIIKMAGTLPSLSATDILSQLKKFGVKAPIFAPMKEFLVDVEGCSSVTYPDSKKIMTIGIGVNLSINGVEALFYALNPTRDWDLPNMRKTAGLPNPPLTSEEIEQLLCFTLTGVKNAKGLYIGQTASLEMQLKALSDVQFKANQLITLQSLSFNNHELIGDGIIYALNRLTKYGDLETLIEIMEYSNKGLDVGLQNRRLKESSLFHGREDHPTLDVHLNWRQYQRFLLNDVSFELVGGNVIWGLPSGEEQEDYNGGNTIVTVKPVNTECLLNEETYGTTGADYFSGIAGSLVVFGGGGDDVIKIDMAPESYDLCRIQAPYLAGGRGYDTYVINATDTFRDFKVIIYDADRLGQVIINGQHLHGLILDDIIMNIEGQRDIYYLSEKIKTSDNSYFITLCLHNDYVCVTIPNYIGGQFNIIFGNEVKVCNQGDVMAQASLFGNKYLVSSCDEHLYSQRVDINDMQGVLLKSIELNFGYYVDSFIVPNTNQYFGIYWTHVEESEGRQKNKLLKKEYKNTGEEIGQSTVLSCDMISPPVGDCFTELYVEQDPKTQEYSIAYSTDSRCNCTSVVQAKLSPLFHKKDIEPRDYKRPANGTYALHLNHGNRLLIISPDIWGLDPIVELRNERNDIIWRSRQLVGDLTPSTWFDDGNAFIVQRYNRNYYLEASALSSGSPQQDGYSTKQQSVPKEKLSTPPKYIPTIRKQIQQELPQVSSASRASSPLTTLVDWAGHLFGKACGFSSESQQMLLEAQTDGAARNRGKQASQMELDYVVAPVANFALIIVGFHWLKSFFGDRVRSDDLEDLGEENTIAPISEDKIEQAIVTAEKYLSDCAIKLSRYKQLSMLLPEQVSEIDGLLWAIGEHRITLDEAKEAETTDIAAQTLGELSEDLKHFQIEFVALEKEIRGRAYPKKPMQTSSLAGNRYSFYHNATGDRVTGAGYLLEKVNANTITPTSIVPSLL